MKRKTKNLATMFMKRIKIDKEYGHTLAKFVIISDSKGTKLDESDFHKLKGWAKKEFGWDLNTIYVPEEEKWLVDIHHG